MKVVIALVRGKFPEKCLPYSQLNTFMPEADYDLEVWEMSAEDKEKHASCDVVLLCLPKNDDLPKRMTAVRKCFLEVPIVVVGTLMNLRNVKTEMLGDMKPFRFVDSPVDWTENFDSDRGSAEKEREIKYLFKIAGETAFIEKQRRAVEQKIKDLKKYRAIQESIRFISQITEDVLKITNKPGCLTEEKRRNEEQRRRYIDVKLKAIEEKVNDCKKCTEVDRRTVEQLNKELEACIEENDKELKNLHDLELEGEGIVMEYVEPHCMIEEKQRNNQQLGGDKKPCIIL